MKTNSFIAIAVMAFSATAFAQSTTGSTSAGPTDSMVDQQPSTTTTTPTTPDQGGQEQTTTPSNQSNTSTTTAPSDSSAMSPKQVCEQLVQASKTQVSQKQNLDRWVYREGRSEKAALPQRDWIKSQISMANCGDETIAGDHAFVVSRTGDSEKFLPFIKQDNSWKLDMHAYRAFYRMDKRVPASK